MPFRVESNKHISETAPSVDRHPLASDGLSAKSLARQAFAEGLEAPRRVKAKPFGWPLASLDPAKRRASPCARHRCLLGADPLGSVSFHTKRRGAVISGILAPASCPTKGLKSDMEQELMRGNGAAFIHHAPVFSRLVTVR